MTASPTLTTPPGPALTGTRPTSLLQAWPALLGLCLTMLVEMVDNSILNVALPTIARDLGTGPTGLQWVVGAYSLTFGGLLLVGGTLGDMLGRRRTLLIGLALFGLVNLGVLLVDSTAGLIAVRALAGAVAAMIAPLTMSLAFRLFDDQKLRGQAIGLIVTVAMVGFAIGPVLSGLAVEHWDWHSLLVLNAPVAALAWFGVRLGIDADDPADRRTGRADVPGAVLSVLALGAGLYSLTSGAERGWTDVVTLAVAATAAVAGAAFLHRQRTTTHPMFDLGLFTRPTVRGSALLQLAVQIAMVAVMYASTQVFQFSWGWSPVRAGLASLPFVLGMLAFSPLGDAAVARLGHRVTSAIGIALVLAGMAGWWFALDAGYWLAAIAMVLGTGGVRFTMTSCALALLEALPEDHTSIGSALNDTAQEVGSSVGVAIVGTVTATVLGGALPAGVWDAATVHGFDHALHVAFVVIAALVVATSAVGLRTLTDSRTTEEH